jgi:hypothetical protein
MVASFPHFLAADPAVRDKIVGMHPDTEKHSGYVTVEPVNPDVLIPWYSIALQRYMGTDLRNSPLIKPR